MRGSILAGVISVLVAAPAFAGGGLASISGGTDAFQAQTRLKELGYLPGRLDGYYGPRTAAALKSFQRTEELAATGALDAKTLERLEQIPTWFLLENAPIAEALEQDDADAAERQDVIQLYTTAQVEDAKVRAMAVDLLSTMKSGRAAAALRLVMLTNSLASVRVAAAKKIAAHGDLTSLDALAFALDFEKDPAVHAEIASALDHAIPLDHVRAARPTAVAEELPLPLD